MHLRSCTTVVEPGSVLVTASVAGGVLDSGPSGIDRPIYGHRACGNAVWRSPHEIIGNPGGRPREGSAVHLWVADGERGC